jgi:acetate kinase
MQAGLSGMNDLNQLYGIIKKNVMKQNSLKKMVHRLRICILAFVLTMVSLLVFLFSTGIR